MTEQEIKLQRLLSNSGSDVAEWQIRTLNVWPKLFFPEVTKHKVAVNIEERTVTYFFTIKGKRKLRKPQLLCRLEEAAQGLLGGSWEISVVVGRSKVYTGSRLEEVKDTGVDMCALDGYNPNTRVTIRR